MRLGERLHGEKVGEGTRLETSPLLGDGARLCSVLDGDVHCRLWWVPVSVPPPNTGDEQWSTDDFLELVGRTCLMSTLEMESLGL